MAYKRYWYIKANRQKWKDKHNSENNNLDWGLIRNNDEYSDGVLFSASHMIRDYFEQMQPDDIVVLHSTHKANTKYNPKEYDTEKKFVPAARIVGISTVNEALHYEDRYDDEMISVNTKDMVYFRKSIPLKEIKKNELLCKAEPFNDRGGKSRFTLTELEKEEYEELKEIILEENPDAEEKLEELEED